MNLVQAVKLNIGGKLFYIAKFIVKCCCCYIYFFDVHTWYAMHLKFLQCIMIYIKYSMYFKEFILIFRVVFVAPGVVWRTVAPQWEVKSWLVINFVPCLLIWQLKSQFLWGITSINLFIRYPLYLYSIYYVKYLMYLSCIYFVNLWKFRIMLL